MNRIFEASLWAVGVLGALLFCIFFTVGMIMLHRVSWEGAAMVLLAAVAGAKGAVMMLEAYRRRA